MKEVKAYKEEELKIMREIKEKLEIGLIVFLSLFNLCLIGYIVGYIGHYCVEYGIERVVMEIVNKNNM